MPSSPDQLLAKLDSVTVDDVHRVAQGRARHAGSAPRRDRAVRRPGGSSPEPRRRPTRTAARRESRSSARRRCAPRSPSSATRSSVPRRCTSRRGRRQGARRRAGRPAKHPRERTAVPAANCASASRGNRDPVRAVDGPRQPGTVVAPRREAAPEVMQAEEHLRGAHEVRARARQRPRRRAGTAPRGHLRRRSRRPSVLVRRAATVTSSGAANAGPSCQERTQPG